MKSRIACCESHHDVEKSIQMGESCEDLANKTINQQEKDVSCSQRIINWHKNAVQYLQIWTVKKWMVPLAMAVNRRPFLFIIGPVIASLLFASLAVVTDSIDIQSNIGQIMTDPDSYPARQDAFEQEHFGRDRSIAFLIHKNGDNIINSEAVRSVFDLIESFSLSKEYETICLANGTSIQEESSACSLLSPSMMWNNLSDFESFISVADLIEEENDLVGQALANTTFPDGTLVPRNVLYGNYDIESHTSGENITETSEIITSAKSFRVILTRPRYDGYNSLDRDLLDISKEVESEWAENGSQLNIEIWSDHIESNEIEQVIASNLPLLLATFVSLFLFASLAITFFKRGNKRRFRSAMFLGFGTVACVILSILTGYGVGALAGIPIAPANQVLPFVVFGIGIDDSIVLLGAMEKCDGENQPVEEKLEFVFESVGPTILLTTITDCVAFGIGAMFTSAPAVRWFCSYAVIIISIDFLYQVTFFIAIMVFEERKNSTSSQEEDAESNETSSDQQEKLTKHDFVRLYARLLAHPVSKGVVVVCFLGFFGLMVYYVTTITFATDILAFLPDDSDVADFVEADQSYASEGAHTPAYLYYHGLNQSSDEDQLLMDDFATDIASLDFVKSHPNLWYSHFEEFKNSTEELYNSTFNEAMDEFLASEPYKSMYAGNLIRNEHGEVVISRVAVTLSIPLYDSDTQVEALKAQRQLTVNHEINGIKEDSLDRSFLFRDDFLLFYHYQTLPRELMTALIVEVVAVGLVCLLLFPSSVAAILAIIVVSMVCIDLLGVIPLLGRDVDMVAGLVLIMSVGLIVDYSLHIIDAFLQASRLEWKTADERMEVALVDIGQSVFASGISTFLGIAVLGFADSQIIRTFFEVFSFMILFGLMHGLVFIPVALTLILPGDNEEYPTRRRSSLVISQQFSSMYASSAFFPPEKGPSDPSGCSKTPDVAPSNQLDTTQGTTICVDASTVINEC